MKTIGIIGGLGPETTAEFYQQIIFNSFQRETSQRPPILIWSVPLKYELETDLITKATGEDRYIPYLIDAAKRLEAGGVDFIVIPCNSVHVFIDEIRSSVKIPVLSIVEETVKFTQRKSLRKVGLLATQLTIQKNLYSKALQDNAVEVVLPSPEDQNRIGKLIHALVQSRIHDTAQSELIEILKKFIAADTSTILLACTDLQLLSPKCDGLEIFDTMQILADATVEYSLGIKHGH